MSKYQCGMAIPWHLVIMVVLIFSLMGSTALYRSWYQAEEQKYERVNTTFAIFKEQTAHAQKAFEEAHKLASGRAAAAEKKWRKYAQDQGASIRAKYDRAKRLRDERDKELRSQGHDIPKEPDSLQRVSCESGDGRGFADNYREYRTEVYGADDDRRREIQTALNTRRDSIDRQLGESRDNCLKELRAIKGNIHELDLIEGK